MGTGWNEAVPIGTERKNSSHGYWMIKTKSGWRFKHHVIAEEQLGRFLEPNERVTFIDGDRDNLDPSNIKVTNKGASGVAKRRDNLERQRRRLQWEINERQEELARVQARLNELNVKYGKKIPASME